VLFKFVREILDVSSEDTRLVDSLPVLDVEVGFEPVRSNFFSQLDLQLELLVSVISYIFDIVFESKKVCFEQSRELEGVRFIGNVFLGDLDDFLPMSGSNRGLCEGLHEGQDLGHVLDLLLELLIGLPSSQLSGQASAVLLVLLDLRHHVVDLGGDVTPGHVFPLHDVLLHLLVERVQLVQQFYLSAGFVQFRVISVGQPEQGLSRRVGSLLSVAHGLAFLELLKSVKSF